MNVLHPTHSLSGTRRLRRSLNIAFLSVCFLAGAHQARSQTVQPLPTATPAPSVAPPISTPPGLLTAADVAAYNAAYTPLIQIVLAAVTPTTSSLTSAGANIVPAFQPAVYGGVSQSITLPPPAAAPQPVATVTLTYNASLAGQLVWVQPLRGGALTATDGKSKVYDGSRGFYLTLGAAGTTTFNYQAPNASGTYQVLTRFANVLTTLSFLVPDPAP